MILVTGATGFIGRSLSRWLRRNRREFVCLIRPGRQASLPFKDTPFFEGDLTRPETLAPLFEKYPIRRVVHLAARILGNDEKLFERDNVQATANLLEACRKVSLERFLFISSGDVLSSYESSYARSKKKAEQKVRESGLPFTILRPFRVIGSGDQSFGRMTQKMKRFPAAVFLGTGDAVWQPLYVEDVSRAIVQAMDSPRSVGGTYAISGREKMTYPDFLNRVRAKVNPRCALIYLPSSLCFFILKMICAVYPSFPVSPSNLQNMLESKICDFSASARDFGYDPMPLDAFLPSLVNGLESAIERD